MSTYTDPDGKVKNQLPPREQVILKYANLLDNDCQDAIRALPDFETSRDSWKWWSQRAVSIHDKRAATVTSRHTSDSLNFVDGGGGKGKGKGKGKKGKKGKKHGLRMCRTELEWHILLHFRQ
eukprot:SAG22_NODE_50_length_24611_cov_74.139687_13_plen_122_part_00